MSFEVLLTTLLKDSALPAILVAQSVIILILIRQVGNLSAAVTQLTLVITATASKTVRERIAQIGIQLAEKESKP